METFYPSWLGLALPVVAFVVTVIWVLLPRRS
jgi:hypothetical protein